MIIELNGSLKNLAYRTAYEARDDIGTETDIVILNGFQLSEDCNLSENDIVTIIKKGTMPKEEELECMMMARHTPTK